MRKWLGHLMAFGIVSTSMALEPKEVMEWPRTKVENALPDSHPMAYYVYASRLFSEGDRGDALFWYYVGELRYRFYLAANPNLPSDAAPALFASLHESVGSVVTDHGKALGTSAAAELQRALDWDASHHNGVTSKSLHAKDWLRIRADFSKIELGSSTGP